jgi:hypothetical protein
VASTKLFIYSADDKDQAEDRFDPGDVVELPASSVDELQKGLERLVTDGFTFDRVLVQTHGRPGEIIFGNESLWHYLLDRDFAGRYEKLFPTRTKIYFDGCNVARGDQGWRFLESAGKVLLRSGGGIVMGWTSYGYAYSSWIPFIGGHTVHWRGSVRFIEFTPGGRETFRYDFGDSDSMGELMAASRRLNSY